MSSIYDEMSTVPPHVQEVLDRGEQIRALLYKYEAESEAREVEMLMSMTEAVAKASKDLKEARERFAFPVRWANATVRGDEPVPHGPFVRMSDDDWERAMTCPLSEWKVPV